MPTDADPELMRLLNFTADDLDANRQRKLTERQSKRLRRDMIFHILVYLFIPRLLLRFLRFRRDINEGRVESCVGAIRHQATMEMGGRFATYVGEQQLIGLSGATTKYLKDKRTRFYYAPHSFKVLSAELI